MVLLITFSEFREILHLCDNTCTVAGLLPGRTYSFRVKAKNKAGVRHNISELLFIFNFNTFFQPLDSISRPDGTFGFTLLLVLVLAPILSVLRFSSSHKNLKTKFQLHLETSDEKHWKGLQFECSVASSSFTLGLDVFSSFDDGSKWLHTSSLFFPSLLFFSCVIAVERSRLRNLSFHCRQVGKVSAVSHITTAPGSPDTPRAPDTLCRSAAAIIVSWEVSDKVASSAFSIHKIVSVKHFQA